MENQNIVPNEANANVSEGQTIVETLPTSSNESTSTIPQNENVGSSEQAWMQDQRFAGKTPDDIYKSYRELESHLGDYKSIKEKAQMADLLQNRLGITPDEINEYIANKEQEEQQEQQREIEENPGAVAYREVESLKDQLALEHEKSQLNSFIEANPELSPIKAQLFKLAITAERDTNLSYNDIFNKYYGDAMKIASTMAYEKIGEKQQMSSTTPTSSDVKKPNLEELSVAELEKILPHSQM